MIFSCLWGASKSRAETVTFLHIGMEQPPLTLNPRLALDAVGQRVGSLLFRGLTRLDANLVPIGDGAKSWRQSADGKSVIFTIAPGPGPSATEWTQCLENYRKPSGNFKPSPLAASFPGWIATTVHEKTNEVEVVLNHPDPYLTRNLSLVRYFRVGKNPPCQEGAKNEPWEFSGLYAPKDWSEAPQISIELLPRQPAVTSPQAAVPERRPVKIHFIRDENTRALRLIKGDLDLVINGISLAKTRWIQKKHPEFVVLERPGTSVQYLSFCMGAPVIANPLVRRALAHAIPRRLIVDHKMFGFGQIANSFLSPDLEEYSPSPALSFDPERSKKLLNQAGYPENERGIRLTLKYRTTPVREGREAALIFKDVFKKVGVELELDVVEPTVFFLGIKQGKCQLYSSRWVGVADASIYLRTLGTKQPLNRVKYSNPLLDALLLQTFSEQNLERRKLKVKEIETVMQQDLPYFPLWFWGNAVIVKKELAGKLDAHKISLSGALDVMIDQLQ